MWTEKVTDVQERQIQMVKKKIFKWVTVFKNVQSLVEEEKNTIDGHNIHTNICILLK